MSHLRDAKNDVLTALGFFWTRVFLDSDFVDGYSTSIGVELAQLNELTEVLPDYASRRKTPIKHVRGVRLFIFNETDLDTNAARYGQDGVLYDGQYSYGQQTMDLDEWRYPIDPDFCPNFLTTGILNPERILTKDVDYTISDGTITFLEDPLLAAGLDKRSLPTADGPRFQFFLWGFNVEEDISAVCDYFGTVAGVCGPSNETYHKALNIAWDLRVEGATVQNIHRMLSVITNTDYVHTGGKIHEIFYEGDRICVRTEENIYTAPGNAKVVVPVGTTIEPGDIIFDTFSVKHGSEPIDFDEFEGLTLDQGYLATTVGGSLFLPNQTVPVTLEKHPDWFGFTPAP
jgi:hypothetical protein